MKLVLPNHAVPRLSFLTIKAGGEEKPEREEVVEPLEEPRHPPGELHRHPPDWQ